MLDISDFAKGGKAYVLERESENNRHVKITEVDVVNIGKDFVEVGNPICARYNRTGRQSGLCEITLKHSRSELYTSRYQANYQIRLERLADSVKRNMKYLNDCCVNDLSLINNILLQSRRSKERQLEASV